MEKLCYRGVKECADAMGIDERTLRKLYRSDPTFPVIRTGERNQLFLFPVKQIEEWVALRVNGGNREQCGHETQNDGRFSR